MKQPTLFEVPEVEPKKEETNGLTCRTCIHRYKHEYGKMFYCRKQKSNRTSYGNKKIKAGDTACRMYESNK